MIGLALVSFVTVFAAGLRGSIDDAIDKTLAGDLIVSEHGRLLGHPDAVGEAVADVEGVEIASPTRFAAGRGRGRRRRLRSPWWTPATAADVLTLDVEEGCAGAAHRARARRGRGRRGLGGGERLRGRRHVRGRRRPPARRSTTRSRARSRTTPTSSANYVGVRRERRGVRRGRRDERVRGPRRRAPTSAAVRAAIEDVLGAELPDRPGREPGGAEGLDRRAAQRAARDRLRAAGARR